MGLEKMAREGGTCDWSMERKVRGRQVRERYVMRVCFKLRAEQMCKLRKRIG